LFDVGERFLESIGVVILVGTMGRWGGWRCNVVMMIVGPVSTSSGVYDIIGRGVVEVDG
jgi:hypothetical protein